MSTDGRARSTGSSRSSGSASQPAGSRAVKDAPDVERIDAIDVAEQMWVAGQAHVRKPGRLSSWARRGEQMEGFRPICSIRLLERIDEPHRDVRIAFTKVEGEHLLDVALRRLAKDDAFHDDRQRDGIARRLPALAVARGSPRTCSRNAEK